MTHYPNSACEKHRDVTTDAPICPVCLVEKIDAQAAEIERLRAALSKIEAFPNGYWSGEANLDYELSKRIGIARAALEKREAANE